MSDGLHTALHAAQKGAMVHVPANEVHVVVQAIEAMRNEPSEAQLMIVSFSEPVLPFLKLLP